jgi:hypothetical protein
MKIVFESIFLFFIASLLLSCDILRTSPFEVIAWSPGEGDHDSRDIKVSLTFSREPDRTSVERSFSLTEDAQAVAGFFIWEGSTLVFKSSFPLSKNRDYLITLKTDAQNKEGLSLERQFRAAFSSRPESSRPVLLESNPVDGGIIREERDRVELLFSTPLDRNSLSNLSFVPSVPGVWSLEDGGRRACFTPSESWTAGREYRLNAGSAVSGDTGLDTGREYTVHFLAGIDSEGPRLLSAYAEDKQGNAVLNLLTDINEHSGWERDWKLVVEFSETVDLSSVVSALSCEPSLGPVLDTPPGFGERAVIRFSETPVYGSRFTLTLGKNVKDRIGNTADESKSWVIRADGAASKAPVLTGIRIPSAPGAVDEKPLCYSRDDLLAYLPFDTDYFPSETPVPVWMELYFETAPHAVPDLFSLMDCFKLSATNTALVFSPREFKTGAFTMADVPEGWESLVRVELRGMITNKPFAGMVTIEVGAGLEDTLGNVNAEAARILLLK